MQWQQKSVDYVNSVDFAPLQPNGLSDTMFMKCKKTIKVK